MDLIEKLVTSSPEELAKLNSAIGRLNNNMMGVANIGSTSEQREQSLQAFNMLAPLLGEGQQQNVLKANVLESMLLESGMGVSPMFAQILDSLRNPEGDPQMAEAIRVYNEGLNLQSSANQSLGRIQELIAKNNAETAALKLKEAITGATLNFDQTMLKNINDGIQRLVSLQGEKAKDAVPKMMGGIVYASTGQQINFQPKGTDTVPAMLTPGEFVVNRRSTRDNLPLLQNINSGNYNRGGKVSYYAAGGLVIDKKWTRDKDITDEQNKKSETLKVSERNIYPSFSDEDRNNVTGTVKPTEAAQTNPLLRFNFLDLYAYPAGLVASSENAGILSDWSSSMAFENGSMIPGFKLPIMKSPVNLIPGIGYNSIEVDEGGVNLLSSLGRNTKINPNSIADPIKREKALLNTNNMINRKNNRIIESEKNNIKN